MRVLTPPEPSEEDVIATHVAVPANRPRDRGFVRLNMISSSDGGTAIAGVSGGLGNRNDHAVFAALARARRRGVGGDGDRGRGAVPSAGRRQPPGARDRERARRVGQPGALRIGSRHARAPRGLGPDASRCDRVAVRHRRARRPRRARRAPRRPGDRAGRWAPDRRRDARARAGRRVLPHRRADGDLRRVGAPRARPRSRSRRHGSCTTASATTPATSSSATRAADSRDPLGELRTPSTGRRDHRTRYPRPSLRRRTHDVGRPRVRGNASRRAATARSRRREERNELRCLQQAQPVHQPDRGEHNVAPRRGRARARRAAKRYQDARRCVRAVPSTPSDALAERRVGHRTVPRNTRRITAVSTDSRLWSMYREVGGLPPASTRLRLRPRAPHRERGDLRCRSGAQQLQVPRGRCHRR